MNNAVDYNSKPLIGGEIREVTITLAEYRELVTAKAQLRALVNSGALKVKEDEEDVISGE